MNDLCEQGNCAACVSARQRQALRDNAGMMFDTLRRIQRLADGVFLDRPGQALDLLSEIAVVANEAMEEMEGMEEPEEYDAECA